MIRRLAAPAALALAVACAGPRLRVGPAPGGEVIEAEGLVPYRAEDLPGTKAGALAAAQRSAVERVVGVYVSGQTRVAQAVAIDSRILARSAGYVKKYDILKEWKDEGFYKTRIRALVSYERVESDLKEFGLLEVQAIGNPRVAVLLDESVDGSPADTAHAGDGLTAALVAAGYTVLERSAKAGAVMAGILRAVEAGDAKAVGDLGSQLGVDVLIVGDAGADKLDPHPRFAGFSSYRARASAKALRAGTGQVLAAAAKQASGLEAQDRAASAKALGAAGELLGEALKLAVAEALRSRAEIVVRADKVGGMDELSRLQEALRGLAGVEAVRLRRYGGGSAELSVSAGAGSGQELAGRLQGVRSPALAVRGASAGEIELELIK